ncbi:MAG TPA: class II aldolase/adducin family protein [Streptosporangiaceae bacterium]|nr:class II aldolase/adducin family protein [Streptosporangiaceae bacterium]
MQHPGNEVAEASRVLSVLGLVSAFGHVSQRTGSAMLITPPADLGLVTAADLVEVDLDATSLPPGAPAEAWAHLAVYAARSDVAAIARAQPSAAFAVSALAGELPVLHGQACWLGPSVPIHENARLLRSAELAEAAAEVLGPSDALLLRGNGALTCGGTPGLAVARMWLLEAACQTWLAATASGMPRPMEFSEAESWRAAADELLPRLWLHLKARSQA